MFSSLSNSTEHSWTSQHHQTILEILVFEKCVNVFKTFFFLQHHQLHELFMRKEIFYFSHILINC